METSDFVRITSDLRPAYYDEFHCLAQNCRTNCCSNWQIELERNDYMKIKKQKGSPELNRRLEHSMRRLRDDNSNFYAVFVMNEGVCPLPRKDGLCQLQREKGEGVLPMICKVFPRRETAPYLGYVERSLSPACEGVLALLWEHPEGVEFRSDPLPGEGVRVRRDFKANPMTENFHEIRSLCIDFLQDRRRPLPHRILLMGLALRELAEGETDVPRFLERGRYILEQGDAGALLGNLNEARALELAFFNNIRTLLRLWSGREDKREFLDGMIRWLKIEGVNDEVQADPTAYRSARERYRERFSGRDYFMENLMVSVLFRLALPDVRDPEKLWKSYVSLCNLYAVYQFAVVMSCREGAPGNREELFRLIVGVSRSMIHSLSNQLRLRDEFFQNDSATLAHMAVLLCGT